MWNPLKRRRRYASNVAGSLEPDAPVLTIEYRTLPDDLRKRFARAGRRDARKAQEYPGRADVVGYMKGLASPLRGWYERETRGLCAAISAAARAQEATVPAAPTGEGGPEDRSRRVAAAGHAASIASGYAAADQLLSLFNILRAELLTIAALHEQGMAAYCQGHGSAEAVAFEMPPWFSAIRSDVQNALESLGVTFDQGGMQHVQ